jgi:hypothetical protein
MLPVMIVKTNKKVSDLMMDFVGSLFSFRCDNSDRILRHSAFIHSTLSILRSEAS